MGPAKRHVANVLRIGLISDTHGLLRPEVLGFLEGSAHIIHAGDICDASVLDRLEDIAPLTAVRGNNDRGTWARRLPESAVLELGGVRVHVLHDLSQLDAGVVASDIHVVVFGHSHKPRVERKGAVLYVNPGSAGVRRFKLPVAAAELLIDPEGVTAKVTEFVV